MNFHKMKNKKIFLFAFLSFLIVGCDSVGGVNLTDTKGNKYNFKNESVTCTRTEFQYNGFLNRSTDCEGSGIKKDIAGSRYVVEFNEKWCVTHRKESGGWKLVTDYSDNNFICSAAKQLGKL